MTLQTAVFGASGFAGGELIRTLDDHDGFDLVHLGAHSHEGGTLADVHPQLRNGTRPLGVISAEVGPLDIAFLALPHGASEALGRELRGQGVKVVDLGSDYRFDPQWRYGLPELFDVKDASAVASPGCYPTAILLAIGPLVQAGVVSATGIVADCMSGVTGAGRSLKDELLFGEVAEGVRAYGIANHRHRAEIEMGLGRLGASEAIVTFTPHLVPIQRGLLATVTTQLLTDDNPSEVLAAAYTEAPFVEVIDRPPQTRWTVGSNRALVAGFVDERQGVVIAQCAIDNLGKGAAGQAVQSANLMVGYDETEGLTTSGWMP